MLYGKQVEQDTGESRVLGRRQKGHNWQQRGHGWPQKGGIEHTLEGGKEIRYEAVSGRAF